jgi:hypothetical protein
MSETTGPHYCYYHPNVETELRCNKCGKYICIKDARRTPVGYRCKDCVKEQQDVFFTAMPIDYVIAAIIAFPVSLVAGYIAPRLFWLVIFVAPIVGVIIGEAIRIATKKRRGRYTWIVALVSFLFGSLIPLWPTMAFVLSGGLAFEPQVSGGILINVLLDGVYIVLAGGTLIARLRFG